MKTIEEIRIESGLTKKEFARKIGTSFRTYLARLEGSQPKFRLSEVIKASLMNKGQIMVQLDEDKYELNVRQVIE